MPPGLHEESIAPDSRDDRREDCAEGDPRRRLHSLHDQARDAVTCLQQERAISNPYQGFNQSVVSTQFDP